MYLIWKEEIKVKDKMARENELKDLFHNNTYDVVEKYQKPHRGFSLNFTLSQNIKRNNDNALISDYDEAKTFSLITLKSLFTKEEINSMHITFDHIEFVTHDNGVLEQWNAYFKSKIKKILIDAYV